MGSRPHACDAARYPSVVRLSQPLETTMRPAFVAPRRVRPLRAALAALLLAAAAPGALRAQVEERPVTFDAGQRMTAITPMLAARMRLAAPAWPVTGDYREARAYAAGDAHVLVVQKADGTLARYPLDAGQWAALQAAVAEGMRSSGNPAGEPSAYVYQEVAGTRFARKQLLYGVTVYGPLLSGFADDASSAGALYLTGAAMPSLLAIGFAREGRLLKAQTDLGMDGTLRGALLGSFAQQAIQGSDGGDRKSRAAGALVGSIALTTAGLGVGRGLTDGEAEGMIAGSNYTLGITAGLMASVGAFDEKRVWTTGTYERYDYQTGQYVTETYSSWRGRSGVSRGEWAALAGAGLAGYPLGLAYVRSTRYTVTAGDANALAVPAGIGMLLGAAAAGDTDDERTVWASVTGGLVVGLVAGDRLLVKPFDHTRSQGTLLRVGAVAGGVAGLILPTLSESDDARTWLASAAIGSSLGAAFAHSAWRPQRALGGALREARRDVPDDRRLAGRVTWQLDPMGAAMAAALAPGRHGILSLTF